MSRYDYHRPANLEEALALKADIPDARFVAGGTDIMVQIKKRHMAAPPALVSLRSVPELGGIEVGDVFRIGTGVPVADIARHADIRASFPALVEALRVLGSRQIQNVATLGGNLCNASPAADSAPPLIVYGARAELTSVRGRRELPLEDFFTGPGLTQLAPDEILTAVLLDPPAPTARAAFLRKGRVKMDLAYVIVAVLLELEGGTCSRARAAAGAVAPVPLRLRGAEAVLEGGALDVETFLKAREVAMEEVSPITDLRSTEEYRREMVGVFLGRAVKRILAAGKGAP